jgi:hypothetical protein
LPCESPRRAKSKEQLSLCVTFFGQLLFDNLERAAYFFAQLEEFGSQKRLLGINHHIHSNRSQSFEPDSFPQASFHPVAYNRSAQYLAYGKTDAHAAILLASQKKYRHMRADVTAAALVNLFKISVPE